MIFRSVLFALMGLVSASVNFSLADDSPKNDKPQDGKSKVAAKAEKVAGAAKAANQTAANQTAAISPENESRAIEFARMHHPELAGLLQGLKLNAPKEYQAALNELNRDVDRLTRMKERSPDRYEVELSDWKATSRIRLLAARLTMSKDPAVEAELRTALRERLETRLAVQRTEAERLSARAAKLNQSIEETKSKADSIVDKEFNALAKPIAAKPVAKSKAKKAIPETVNQNEKDAKE